jgi:hypothetical protein
MLGVDRGLGDGVMEWNGRGKGNAGKDRGGKRRGGDEMDYGREEGTGGLEIEGKIERLRLSCGSRTFSVIRTPVTHSLTHSPKAFISHQAARLFF